MRALVFSALIAMGCSGGGSSGSGADEPGTGHAADTLDTDKPDPTTANPCAAGTGDPANPCAAPGDGDAVAAPDPNAPLVTFELHNSADSDIEFNIDKGWSLALFGWSGDLADKKSVRPIIMFPKHCTASCDAEETCPVCEKPADHKEERAAEQRQLVAAGDTFELAWDGNVHDYQKVKKGCECFKAVPVAPETYTLKACGLRVTKSAKKTSKFQCVEAQVTLPPEAPTRVRFDFATLEK